jgi:hypothetical protein
MLRLNGLSHHQGLYKGKMYDRLTIRGQERSNNGYENRGVIEYVIKNYTLLNENDIRRGIKQIVITIGAYHICQLRTKFCPTSCSEG